MATLHQTGWNKTRVEGSKSSFSQVARRSRIPKVPIYKRRPKPDKDKKKVEAPATIKRIPLSQEGIVVQEKDEPDVPDEFAMMKIEDLVYQEEMEQRRQVFMAADSEESNALTIEEFVNKSRELMGPTRRHATVQNETGTDAGLSVHDEEEDDWEARQYAKKTRQLFMKIDANSDGKIDWDEYNQFRMLQIQTISENTEETLDYEFVSVAGPRALEGADENPNGSSVVASCKISTDPHKGRKKQSNEEDIRKQVLPVNHEDLIARILYLPRNTANSYCTVGRDGYISLWSTDHRNWGQLNKKVKNGRWQSIITDAVYMERADRIVVSSMDRRLRFYEPQRLELFSKMRLHFDDIPLCLSCFEFPEKDALFFGDTGGSIHFYEFPLSDHMFSTKKNMKNKYHSGWVNKVQFVHELTSMLSCSADGTLKMTDIEKKKVKRTWDGETRGVRNFVWSRSYKFIASCGALRAIKLWNPYSCSLIHTLEGHTAPVRELLVNEKDNNQLISLSDNKEIKVWDLRTHKCLQTLVDDEVYEPEDKISTILFNQTDSCLVTASNRPKMYPMRWKIKSNKPTSHGHDICTAIYSPSFETVVSGDENSTVLVWDITTGETVFRFQKAHGDRKIRAMCFDHFGRRLITGAADGTCRMWNCFSGGLLGEMVGFEQEKHEITCLLYAKAAGNKSFIVAAGGTKIAVWQDVRQDGKTPRLTVVQTKRHDVEPFLWGARHRDGPVDWHTDDITALAFCRPNFLCSASSVGEILLWNIMDGHRKYLIQNVCNPDRMLSNYGLGASPDYGECMTEKASVDAVVFLKTKSNSNLANPTELARGFFCGCSDGKIRLFESGIGRPEFWFWGSGVPPDASPDPITALYIHEKEERGSVITLLCASDSQGWVKIWDVSNLEIKQATGAYHRAEMPFNDSLPVVYHFQAHPGFPICGLQLFTYVPDDRDKKNKLDIILTTTRRERTIRLFALFPPVPGISPVLPDRQIGVVKQIGILGMDTPWDRDALNIERLKAEAYKLVSGEVQEVERTTVEEEQECDPKKFELDTLEDLKEVPSSFPYGSKHQAITDISYRDGLSITDEMLAQRRNEKNITDVFVKQRERHAEMQVSRKVKNFVVANAKQVPVVERPPRPKIPIKAFGPAHTVPVAVISSEKDQQARQARPSSSTAALLRPNSGKEPMHP